MTAPVRRMLQHALSRCRRCSNKLPCPEKTALEVALREKEYDPVCICSHSASEHLHGHGSCGAVLHTTLLCGCMSFKNAFATSTPTPSPLGYEPEPEGED